MAEGIMVVSSDALMSELAEIKRLLYAAIGNREAPAAAPGVKWQNATDFMREAGIGRRRFARLVDSGMVAAKDIGGRGKVYRWAD